MRLYNPKKFILDGKAIISAEIESSLFKVPQTIFFSYPEKYYDYLSASGDPFFPAILIPAMLSDQVLEVEAPLSPKLLESQNEIQSILSVWYPSKFKKVKVVAKEYDTIGHVNHVHNATFFSLGVDSMYTMLKYLPEKNPPKGKQISSLIYMKGLELPLSTYCKGQEKDVIECIHKVGEQYNLEVIAGETNIRDVFPLDWEGQYFGPGLAATALSLSNRFKNIYIPGSHSYATLFHDPSSIIIDNLWSNERTEIFHDGSETDRAGKITSLIVHDQFALNNLRVCVCNEGGCFNCGTCSKCVRTMITLKIIGKLREAGSFPDELPRDYVRALRIFKPRSMVFTIENLKLAQEYGNKELEKVLQNEIRIGRLDLFREGKSYGYLLNELLYYLFTKTGRKIKTLNRQYQR